MTRAIVIAFIGAGVMMLAGCASSPPVRYYGLSPVAASADKVSGDEIVGLGPLDFPDYLNRPQIVLRSSANEFRIGEFDRWAEPIQQTFTRSVASHVDSQLNNAIIVAFPYRDVVSPRYRIIGRVNRFDADETGKTVLVVQWGGGDHEGHSVIASRTSQYETQAADPKDYASIVAALNQTVILFSSDIATALSELLQETR
jgi:uncharacterized lipoprotein YmbA